MTGLVRKDLAFPFRIDSVSQQAATAGYAAHVEQMVRQLLLTTPGERVNLPQFGCGLRALAFGPMNDALAATVKLRVIQGLTQWLAGVVRVGEVTVATGLDGLAEPGAVMVTVTYTLVETLTEQTVTVTVG
jgi:phage baseplate assembly protein W